VASSRMVRWSVCMARPPTHRISGPHAYHVIIALENLCLSYVRKYMYYGNWLLLQYPLLVTERERYKMNVRFRLKKIE
jgi:hypothetical protein